MYTALKPQGYVPRLIDRAVEQRLRDFGAVEICGTRWSGKSWTAASFANSITQVDDDPMLYRDDPGLALVGAFPHAIDEWQDAPGIWNRVRHSVDAAANQPGRFIMTGSSSLQPSEDDRHSGAGRISRLRMRTMTLAELGISSAAVSMEGLFDGRFDPQPSTLGLDGYAEAICRGGWPALRDAPLARAQGTIAEYLDLLFDVSMRKLGKDPLMARRLAVALARSLGGAPTLKTLAADAAGGERTNPAEETVASYLSDFALNYFLDELPGWDAPVRARSRVRTKPKRYLDDPSMAASLLGVEPARLVQDGQLLGVLFESLCVHDLSVYASLLPGASQRPLRYYADADGLEVDVVIELRDGRWAAMEVKLSDDKVDAAAKSLRRLAAKVASNPAARNRQPEFMAVVVGRAPLAYQRKEDGIYVLPLDTLTA